MLKEQIINEIKRRMSDILDGTQSHMLVNVLSETLKDVDFISVNNALSTDMYDNKKLINSFLTCKRIDGLSRNSEKTYLYSIKMFMEYTHYMPLLKTDTNIIRCYLVYLENRGNSKPTIDNNRRNLNSFFQWLENEGYIDKNPCRKIKKIKEPHRIKRFFTELEMEKLRDACENKRERALIDLLLSSGLRIGEIPGIKLSDVNWEEGSFTVIGKGDKQRKCYMNVKAKKHMQEYVSERHDRGICSEYLFCGNKKSGEKPLCKEVFGKIVKTIGNRCGIDDIHIHGIRAFFATNLSNKGVEPSIIQELMGHDDYSTTVRYYCKNSNMNIKKAVSEYCI